MNRVVDSKYDDRRESFTYDSVGNRLTKTTNNITEKYSYNVKNQLQELRTNNSKTLFTYDKQGNTINEEHYSYSFSNSSSNEVNGSHLEVKSGLDVVSSTNTLNITL